VRQAAVRLDDSIVALIISDEPIFAQNPKKACSNVYMQCAINKMGVEGDFRYDVIAGGILFCDNTTLAFDNDTKSCVDKQQLAVCSGRSISIRSIRFQSNRCALCRAVMRR